MCEESKFRKLQNKCIAENKHYQDLHFKPSSKTFGATSGDYREVVWLRPAKIAVNPQFVINGFSRHDIKQGLLGDCWLLAALGSLVGNMKLFREVVPEDNDKSFNENYAGVFHFREWIEIIIDDLLPTVNGQLKFSRCTNKNEFWVPLLEKAYAKFYGTYSMIHGGFSSEAMVDFSGGIIERVEMENIALDSFSLIKDGFERGSMIVGTVTKLEPCDAAIRAKGLVNRHTFTISKAFSVKNKFGRTLHLLRVRNPYGTSLEWNGRFSDDSEEWNTIPEAEAKKLRKIEADGEFFMTYKEFYKNFDIVEICHASPEFWQSVGGFSWKMNYYDGRWIAGLNNCPQIIVLIGNKLDKKNLTTMMVSLIQKNRRETNVTSLPVKIDLYRLSDAQSKSNLLNHVFFDRKVPIQQTELQYHRDICERFYNLSFGYYAIVPRTLVNESEDFLLRIYIQTAKGRESSEGYVKTNLRYEPLAGAKL